MIRATAVLPVPGGPRNTKCCIGLSVLCPATARRRAASTAAVIDLIWAFTAARPIMASSSAIASSTLIGGQLAAACDLLTAALAALRSPSPACAARTGLALMPAGLGARLWSADWIGVFGAQACGAASAVATDRTLTCWATLARRQMSTTIAISHAAAGPAYG